MKEKTYYPFITVILFIAFIILIVIVLVSLSYSDENTVKSLKTMESDITNSKVSKTSTEPYSLNLIPLTVEFNTNTFEINNIDNNTGFILQGNFSNSCLSIYKNSERIHSRIINGNQSLIFASNLSLSGNLFKLSKFKSTLLPLTTNGNYKIAINRIYDAQLNKFNVKYNVNFKEIVYTYNTFEGTNEYDVMQDLISKGILIEQKSRSEECNYTIYNYNRVYGSNFIRADTWEYKGQGPHIVVVVPNGNLTLKGDIELEVQKSPSIEYKIYHFDDKLNLVIHNRDYKSTNKNINDEYIDFITSPKFLMDKFLYGSESRKTHYDNLISDKIIVLKGN